VKEEFKAVSHLISIARIVQELNFRYEKKYDLSLAQWLLLMHLKDLPGCSALRLADSLAVQPGSLTPAFKRLKRKGYIEISEDPKDSRKKNFWLTRKGLDKVQALQPALQSLFQEISTGSMQKMSQALDFKRQVEL
jgi:DNA-binding MarR family transcriptional regulator